MFFARNDGNENRYLTILEAAGIARKTTEMTHSWDFHPDGNWLVVRHPGMSALDQGWKLHVSANLASADEVLRRALTVLLTEPVCFKCARSPQFLVALNEGSGGASQIGKFITIYPNDDAQAVRLAVALDEATRGLTGPMIASDRPLTQNSLVHYRYGGFSGTIYLQNKMGQMFASIRRPDGTLEPDRRPLMFQPPVWAEDPFEKAGVVAPLPTPRKILHQRYVHLTTIYRSSRSAVYLMIDVLGGKRCVVKEVRHDLTFASTGLSLSEGLKREAEILRVLAPNPRFPEVYYVFEEDNRLYMVMEDIAGQTFEKTIIALRLAHRLPTNEQVRRWGIEMATIMGTVHAKGYVYRDLKTANLIVAPDGRMRLVDFDLAAPIGTVPLSPGSGTRGYSPQTQTEGGVAAISDDIYSIGAMLYFAATGAEPSTAPDAYNLLSRPIRALNPDAHPALVAVIERCLSLDLTQRFATTDALRTALTAISLTPTTRTNSPLLPSAHYRTRAKQLGETLLSVALPVLDKQGLAWLSKHATGVGIYSRDINSGTGGALLAILDLAAVTGDTRYFDAARKGATWLAAAPVPEGAVVSGLYVGDAGRVFLFARTGDVLNDDYWRNEALSRSHALAELPHDSPDLFNGTAGRLRTHLYVWSVTGDDTQLDYAREAAGAILAAATVEENGDTYWVIPEGMEDLSGHTYFGYAHGAAGIADALLDLYLIEPTPDLHRAIEGTAAWITRHALSLDDDPDTVVWGHEPGKPATLSYWCHGGTGVAQFLLRAGAAFVMERGIPWAARAARAVTRSTRWSGPTQCHGLAGNIDLLLNLYNATGEHQYYDEAHALGVLLDSFGVWRDGNLVWSSENPEVFTPDFMVGYAGVVTTLLRLSDPTLPHPLHPILTTPTLASVSP